MARARNERGQVLPLVALVLVVAFGAALVLARLGTRAAAQAGAQAAADAAALAGAAAGEPAARELATANDAELLLFEVNGERVRVTVRRHDAVASAVAERTGRPNATAYSGTDAPGPARRDRPAGGSR